MPICFDTMLCMKADRVLMYGVLRCWGFGVVFCGVVHCILGLDCCKLQAVGCGLWVPCGMLGVGCWVLGNGGCWLLVAVF